MSSLSGDLLGDFLLGFLSDLGGSFLGEDFDVAARVQVRTDSTVSSVGSSSSLGSTVDLTVVDHQRSGVQALRLSVSGEVIEESKDDLHGLHGPSA